MTCLCTESPLAFDNALSKVRYKCLEEGLDIIRFHASEDRRNVRDQVFSQIRKKCSSHKLFSVVVEKSKTSMDKRNVHAFYPSVLEELFKLVLKGLMSEKLHKLIIITDRLPVQKKKDAFLSAIKTSIKKNLENEKTIFHIYHHDSMSSFGLQAADYCNWALYLYRSKDDKRSLEYLRKIQWEKLDITL